MSRDVTVPIRDGLPSRFRWTVVFAVVILVVLCAWVAQPPAAHGAGTGAVARGAYSLSLSAKSATITATQVATLKALPSPLLTNQRYIYLRASADGRTWRRVGRMLWNSSAGRYTLRTKPSAHTYYRAYWYDGTGRTRAISPRIRIYVRPYLRFYSTNYTFAWGRRVRFFGSLWPNHYRQKVRIQLKSGSTWVPLLWARLNRGGSYSTKSFKPRLTGSYQVRAVFYAPDWNHLGTTRGPKTLTVRKGSMSPEGRAVWVTRFDYRSRRQIARIMRNAWEANLNTVYLQVRGQADAYYASNYEPWAARLTATSANPNGTLGKNPGWDPLAYAISVGHAYGIKVHAWVNVYPIWMGKRAPSSAALPKHIYYTGGSAWRVRYRYSYKGHWRYRTQGLNAGYLYGSPGNASLRAHIKRVVLDIASNYDVDGIHLDKVRYPGRQYSYDAESWSAYGLANEAYKSTHGGRSLSYAVWRWRQGDALVRDVYDGVKAINPEIQVSAASYGLYTNRFHYRGVTEGLGNYYENSQGWIGSGHLDTLVPQIFWDRSHTPSWSRLVSDFASHRNGRNIYAGIGSYMYRPNWGEVLGQVAESRSSGAQGVSFFDYQSLGRRWQKLNQVFPEMADVPLRGEKTVLSLVSRTTSPTVGVPVTLYCTLLPRIGNAEITVLHYAGTTWEPVSTPVKTDQFGECTVSFVPSSAGNHVLRAIYKGDSTYAPSTSRRVVVDAQP